MCISPLLGEGRKGRKGRGGVMGGGCGPRPGCWTEGKGLHLDTGAAPSFPSVEVTA